jgi:uncharacterized protein (DUF952 family)
MKTIVAIARQEIWQQALKTREYTQSTIDSTLADVGFIHCSFPDQSIEIANRHFSDRDDLILLLIDEGKVKTPVKHEGALSGRAGTFPHIYGPLNIDAVYATVNLEKNDEGKFMSPKELVAARGSAKILEIALPEYKANVKPDYLAIGPKLDKLLERHFMGQDIVLRCIGSQDHPGKTVDELTDIILKTGTDKYDPARKGQGYGVGTDQGKHIDFFGTLVKVHAGTDIFTRELLEDFYSGSLGDRGYAIRIDVVIIYDANKLTKVEHLYGDDVEESDGFVFRDPAHKPEAVLSILKIVG